MSDDHFALVLMPSEIEIDGTNVGGKEMNKHADKKARTGRGAISKIPAVAIFSLYKKRMVSVYSTRSQSKYE